MRTTEQILEIIQERGKNGKPLKRLYRQLYNPQLYKYAYAEIYANKGATTKGAGKETLDGMSEERIDKLIEKIRNKTLKWKPARRTYIEKKNGKTRPLGIPSGDDKLLQAAIKILLEAYYEPTFSVRSHGFRPKRGCGTALTMTKRKHQNTSWFIEGDIKGCFDNIDHETLIGIMGEKIEDQQFLSLIRRMLKAGYMEQGQKIDTYSGTPQGGIVSPLLANIYMDKLDKWVEHTLMPKYNRSAEGRRGKRENLEYARYNGRMHHAKKKGNLENFKMYREKRDSVPSKIVDDEEYRKLEYIRYADDFLLSFSGPKREAEEIKEEIGKFLKDRLKLELSREKTLITHATTQKARFLGYDLNIMRSKDRKTVNGKMRFGVPKEVIKEKCRKYCKKGKPVHRPELQMHSEFDIITQYQYEYRGLVQYYQMAHNIHALSRVYWVMQTSLLKTLASKLKISVPKTSKKFRGTKVIRGREYKVLEVKIRREGKKNLETHFGAIPLKRNPMPTSIIDNKETFRIRNIRSELLRRMTAESCEMCEAKGKVEIHHVRKLADLKKPGRRTKKPWEIAMIAKNRKTLAICATCHREIHKGGNRKQWTKVLESRVP